MKAGLPTIMTCVLLALTLAGCMGSARDTLSASSSGATDEPAKGFARVNSGSEEEFIMDVGRRVYFASGSAKLDDVTRETLDLQAAWLVQHPNWLVKLQGYADDPSKNVALSDQRAKAVMNYLASKGVNPQRMWAKGYGTERKVRNCAAKSCKSQNRRVVVNLRKEFDGAAPQAKQKQS